MNSNLIVVFMKRVDSMALGGAEWAEYFRIKQEKRWERQRSKMLKEEAIEKAKRLQKDECPICNIQLIRYQVHRIKPGRIGGKYVPGNVILVCSTKCHATAEKQSRELYPSSSPTVLILEKKELETFMIEEQMTEVDPRPDLTKDTHLWKVVLEYAKRNDEDVFGLLHAFRCVGAKLVLNPMVHKKPNLQLLPRIGEGHGWATEEEYASDRKKWLMPVAKRVKAVLEGSVYAARVVPLTRRLTKKV